MTFGEVILARKAVKAYASTPIPEKTLAEILRLTQVRSLLVPVQ
jgi:nitroreductase